MKLIKYFLGFKRCRKTDKLNITPNPASNTADLRFNSNEDGLAVMIITNRFGNVVMMKSIPVIKGQNLAKINVSQLVSGWYSVNIQNGAKILTSKIIVTK